MSPTSYFRALSTPTRLLTLLKNISKYQSGKWLKLQIRLSRHSSNSFSQASTIMGEATIENPTRTGMIDPRVASVFQA